MGYQLPDLSHITLETSILEEIRTSRDQRLPFKALRKRLKVTWEDRENLIRPLERLIRSGDVIAHRSGPTWFYGIPAG